MKNIYLFCLLTLVSLSTYARKPAVEDFIGVEPESYKITPPGTEVLYNFEQNVQALGLNTTETSQSPWFAFTIMGAFILLPAFLWFGMTRNQPTPKIAAHQTFDQDKDNVHVLKDYRAPEDESKKAS